MTLRQKAFENIVLSNIESSWMVGEVTDPELGPGIVWYNVILQRKD